MFLTYIIISEYSTLVFDKSRTYYVPMYKTNLCILFSLKYLTFHVKTKNDITLLKKNCFLLVFSNKYSFNQETYIWLYIHCESRT